MQNCTHSELMGYGPVPATQRAQSSPLRPLALCDLVGLEVLLMVLTGP
jgi:hypothetical protein